jgi:hypothetical protein
MTRPAPSPSAAAFLLLAQITFSFSLKHYYGIIIFILYSTLRNLSTSQPSSLRILDERTFLRQRLHVPYDIRPSKYLTNRWYCETIIAETSSEIM